MAIEFCECGGMIVAGKGGARCRSCGKEAATKPDVKMTTGSKKSEVVVIENNEPDLPVMDKDCPSCGSGRAYYWLIQTRSMDEPPTQFFRCTACKHVWREYK